MPKGLSSRAAMILLLPVLSIQLIVGFAILQRYHDRSTRQMVDGIVPQLTHVLDRVGRGDSPSAATLDALGFAVEMPGQAGLDAGDRRRIYDVTGRVVIASLRRSITGTRSINLEAADGKTVVLTADTPGGLVQISFPRARVSAANAHQPLTIIVIASLTLMFIAYCFLRNQLRPVLRLAAASDAFGRGEVIDLKLAGASEVRSATQSFLDMRDRIESHAKQRTEFLLRMSHDLKTPLSRIRYGLSLLDDSDDARDLLRDVDLMDGMITESLEFARNGAKEGYQAVDPVALVQDVVTAASLAGQSITCRIDGSPHAVMMRRASMRRAVENLVSNAANYATQCRVTVAESADGLLVSIEDDGPGIAIEDRPIALQSFQRLDKARRAVRGVGLGLGLSIAKDIVTGHGGSLDLDTSPDLGGLRATLRLPMGDMVGPEGLEPPTKAL